MVDAPSQTQDKFIIRLPNGLRERIKAKADESGRSMNAEIVQVLEREYPEPADVMHVHLNSIRRALDAYEKSTNPQQRLYLQSLVELMVKSGEDFHIGDDFAVPRDGPAAASNDAAGKVK